LPTCLPPPLLLLLLQSMMAGAMDLLPPAEEEDGEGQDAHSRAAKKGGKQVPPAKRKVSFGPSC
jgi:hypothetical protein